jgi:hypothetical protein
MVAGGRRRGAVEAAIERVRGVDRQLRLAVLRPTRRRR